MKFVVSDAEEGLSTGREVKTFDGKKFKMLNSIEVHPGEKIRVRLTTLSQLNGRMMSHNWVLLPRDMDPQAYVNKANAGNQYLPRNGDDLIAYTKLAAGGQTVDVTFTAPQGPGAYTFLCSFMAHYVAGMQGTLIVK